MAKANFWKAPDVEKVAEELIPLYHHHLIDYSMRVDYVFTDKAPVIGGQVKAGTMRKVSGFNAFLGGSEDCDPFFVMTIHKDAWDEMTPKQRLALVDHELCHAAAEAKQQKDDGDGNSDMETDNPVKASIRPHDVEEFFDVVRRHGIWNEGVRYFVKAAEEGV